METKNKVLNLIESNQEVRLDSPYNGCGIYMLYVNCFADEKILPIYIGQTNNFKRRLSAHIKDIRNINYHTYKDYFYIFLRAAAGSTHQYEGHYRPCKIYKYMLDHGCNLDDLRMVVLEECDKSLLQDLELKYISEYHAPFFGFNQINTISQFFHLKENKKKYNKLVEKDAEEFHEFIDYGFSVFNYLHAFSNHSHNIHKKELDQIINDKYNSKWFKIDNDSIHTTPVNIHNALFCNYTEQYKQTEKILAEHYSDLIHNIFTEYKIKSKSQENNVLSLLVNNYNHPTAFEVNETRSYLEYYFDRSRRCRECGNMLKNKLNENVDFIKSTNASTIEAYKRLIDFRITCIADSRFSLLFPNVVFDDYPFEAPVDV